MSSNCPNCGAPLKGSTCEYCGSYFPEREPRPVYSGFFPGYYDPYNQIMNLQSQLMLAQTQISQSEQSRYLLSIMNTWRA